MKVYKPNKNKMRIQTLRARTLQKRFYCCSKRVLQR